MLTVNAKGKNKKRTVTVSQGPHYEEFIQVNISGGRFNNVCEVIWARLCRLEEDEVRLASMRIALIDGEASGVVEYFNPYKFTQKQNAEYDADERSL